MNVSRNLARCVSVVLASSFVAAGCGQEPSPAPSQEDPVVTIHDDPAAPDMSGGAAPDQAEALDLGREQEPDQPVDAPPPCDDHGLPGELSIIEGALFTLAPTRGAVTSAQMTHASTWRADDATWRVRMPYGVAGGTLAVSLECEEGSREVEIPVTLARLTWRSREAWDPEAQRGPAAREHAPLWRWDDDPTGLYMYGGFAYRPMQFTATSDLWRYDLELSSWQQLEYDGDAPELGSGRWAKIPGQRRIVNVGGNAPLKGTRSQGIYTLEMPADGTPTWSFTASDDAADFPTLGALVYHAATARLILTLGISESDSGYFFFDQLWELVEPGAATLIRGLRAADEPAGRYGFAYAHDESNDRIVVFSGAGWPSANDPVNASEDLWELDLGSMTWSQLAPTGFTPRGRRNACWAHDTQHNRLVVWGGTADGRSAVQDLTIIDLDRGRERWHTLVIPGAPEARASCSGVYNPNSSSALFGFGNNDIGIYADLHELILD